MFDGTVYELTEVAATPGMDLIVDFVGVQKFNYVQSLGNYDGATNHSVSIQLWDWTASVWLTWDSLSGIEKTMTNHGFHVPCGGNYIGTGADAGKVRVRFAHTMNGNAGGHILYLEAVQLYNLDYRLDHHWGPWR